MMELFQEPTLTALLALIFSFLVAKIVSFAVVSTSSADDYTVVCSADDDVAVAQDVTLDKGLKVGSIKSIERVQFVDDYLVGSVDSYGGSENFESLNDVEIVGKVFEEKSEDEKTIENVDQFGDDVLDDGSRDKLLKADCFGLRERQDDNDYDDQGKGSGKVEMLVARKCDDYNKEGVSGEDEKVSVSSGLTNVIVEEQKNEVVMGCDDMIILKNEGNLVVGSVDDDGLITGDIKEEKEKMRDEIDNDDDWEGIERTELEKVFAEAVNFVEYGGKGNNKDKNRLARLGSDVQMELYGLHKVAVEGLCHEPQPIALKVSARAKWNAWQKLGSMSREMAMDQYIRILSDNIPGWMHYYSADDDIQDSLESEAEGKIYVLENERMKNKWGHVADLLHCLRLWSRTSGFKIYCSTQVMGVL